MNKKKPRTAVVDGRCDKRHLAAIAKTLIEKYEYKPTSNSDLIRTIIESLAEIFIKNNPDHKFESTLDADIYLQNQGYFTNRSGMNKRHLEAIVAHESTTIPNLFPDDDKMEEMAEKIRKAKGRNSDE